MVPVFEFLAFTALGFDISIVVISLLMIGLIEYLHERFATVFLLGLLVFLKYSGRFDILAYGAFNPLGLAFWIAGFVAIGIACVRPAWYGYVSDAIEEEEDRYGKVRDSWLEPQARDYKDVLTSWVFLWPWKMAFFLLKHPVRRVKRAVFRAMEKQLNAMSAKMAREAKARSAKA